jgi:hypothetical protein
MNADRFDTLLAALTTAPSRRTALRVLGGLALAGLVGQAGAKKKKKKKRKKHKKKCAPAGQPTSKKRKQCCPGLVKDGSGLCAQAACVPRPCPANTCGNVPDGCGGTLPCGCGANHLCHDGTCQACTVTCTGGNPVVCGNDLQVALDGGGTVYVCPGRYQGNFLLDTAVTVIGAGQGVAVGANTILDAQHSGHVVRIPGGTGPVILERLRLTRGSTPVAGAGIAHEGTLLHLRDATVTGNTSQFNGGGIAVGATSTLELTRCTIRDNHAPGTSGGGILTFGTATLTDCVVEANTSRFGGGINTGLSAATATTLAGSTVVRGNVAEDGGGLFIDIGTLSLGAQCRVTGNEATGEGGGIFRAGGTVNLAPGSLVCGNTAQSDPQCLGFSDPACQDSCPP